MILLGLIYDDFAVLISLMFLTLSNFTFTDDDDDDDCCEAMASLSNDDILKTTLHRLLCLLKNRNSDSGPLYPSINPTPVNQ